MKIPELTRGLLLSAFIGATSAAPETAAVYIFQGTEWPSSAAPPTISPEEARVILAQRLGVPQYHSIGNADWIPHINTFGGPQDSSKKELVLIVEGVSSTTASPLAKPFLSLWSAFKISQPPSSKWTQKLVKDLEAQVGPSEQTCKLADEINPDMSECWSGNSKVLRVDLAEKSPSTEELKDIKDRLIKYAKDNEMNVAVVFMPETCRSANTFSNPYGAYDMPSQIQIERREQQAEEPMTMTPAGTYSPPKPQSKQVMASANETGELITGVPAVCYASIDACTTKTNNCSGHGKCFQKSGTKGDASCFACTCEAEVLTIPGKDGRKDTQKTTFYGGAACQKVDVSGPFWLLFLVSLVLVGIVGWGITLLFGIGEEKLPSVIGAGVSSKAR